MRDFKLFGGQVIQDVGQYAKNYLTEHGLSHNDILIYVGTDSKQMRRETVYATVIAFYNVFKGAHVIFRRKRVSKIKDIYTRLFNEVEMTREVAEYIDFELKDIYKFEWNESNIAIELGKERVSNMSNEDIKKVIDIYNKKSEHERIPTCDLDLNPNPYWKSNMVHDVGVGLIKGSGFRVRTKPDAWSASAAADLICK